ncbi:hypothetical protein B7494_g958 [Chlorociboria aeruginascens]|nr:hypothetical protein B7494_g958 [Chlorociboria aeruginascens]
MDPKTPLNTCPPPQSATPPPPYDGASSSNPGFCPAAFHERQANRLPGGGMKAASYYEPCSTCGLQCGNLIPGSYKGGWPEWVDPSVNFRWESHVAPKDYDEEKAMGMGMGAGEGKEGRANEELLGCWICWEYEDKWIQPMRYEEWYLHLKTHFKADGYVVCRGVKGAMQRRRNCTFTKCPKIHS